MASGDSDGSRRMLEDSIAKISSLPPGALDDGISHFTTLRRGVTHASNGRDVPPEKILGDLSPKEPVVRLLGELYEKKKMYRKQVESVFVALLKVDDWLCAVQADVDLQGSLPNDMRRLVQEREATRGAIHKKMEDLSISVKTEMTATPDSADQIDKQSIFTPEARVTCSAQSEFSAPVSVPSDSAIRDAVDAARAAEAERAAQISKNQSLKSISSSGVEASLLQAQSQMVVIEYSAANKDRSIEAFETFRRAVMTSKGDSAAVADLEPKQLIMSFLCDVHKKHSKHRRRVAAVFICLWAFEPWKEAIQKNPSVHATVCEIILDSGGNSDALGTEMASLVSAVRGAAHSDSDGTTCGASERLSVLLSGIEEYSKNINQWTPGDKRTIHFFEQVSSKTRELGKAVFRGAASRWEHANALIRPEVALRKAPLYDVEFSRGVGGDGVVLFFKRLFGGWSVKIDKTTFEALAYGEQELAPKAYENVHMLCVHGHVIRTDRVPSDVIPRLSVVVACEDELHLSRHETSRTRQREKEERARDMGFGDIVDHAIQPFLDLRLTQLDVTLDEASCKLNWGSRSVVCPLKCSMITHSSQDEILRVVEDNIECIAEAFELCLSRMELEEKVRYWEALRASNATSQKLLVNLFDACLRGDTKPGSASMFEDAQTVADQYAKQSPGNSQAEIADRLVKWQASLNLSTGFVTGFGGFFTMPVTIPTGMLATWMVSTRLAFAVAHTFGHDLFHPCTVNAVLYCLTGSASAEVGGAPEETLRKRLQAHLQRQQGAVEDINENLVPVEADASLSTIPSSEEFQKQYASLYDLLGLQQDASPQDIRVAYRRLALRYHPDKLQSSDTELIGVATKRFQVLSAAYEILSDPTQREEYDRSLREGCWSWTEFSWDEGLERARGAFDGATKLLTEGILASYSKKYVASGHIMTRAVAQVAVDVVEAIQISSAKSLVQAGAAAELRSSIAAGERLAASAATRSSSKLIPVLGAMFSGAIDCAATASVGRCAVRVFKF